MYYYSPGISTILTAKGQVYSDRSTDRIWQDGRVDLNKYFSKANGSKFYHRSLATLVTDWSGSGAAMFALCRD